ncbi:hypothetical protein GCM10009096_13160 [Parasphingorhabdus litoris]|uniref:Helix-turn-helix domain-containing protein n=1 Tax=Parasphingorhabdus litoris TaxID=394733 RepID=A0ABN1ACN7_9SPHN|nr:hypothetical protein [Parasphingorhabdus litoris]
MKNSPFPTKPDPRSAAVQNRSISRIPAFTPVELRRVRPDGWTPLRQAEFIGFLAETRCVKKAAERVGMSRETAYRLRRKPGADSFVAAWDFILEEPCPSKGADGRKPKVTLETLFQRIRMGSYRPMLRAGRYVGTLQKPDIQALLAAISRLDMVAPSADHRDSFAANRGDP